MNKSIQLITSALVIGSLLLHGAAYGQQTHPLSLEEAIAASLAHSNQLKADQSKIKAASATVQDAKNSRLPDVDISGQYLRMNQPNIDLKFGGSAEGSNDSEAGSDGGFPAVDQAMIGMASASLPLFTGGKINNSIASAKYLETAVQLDAQRDQQQVIQNTVAAYYNLYKAQAAVDLVKENLKSSQQRVKDFQNMEANGLVARNDLLKVQLQESNLELTLINAQNNVDVCNYNFNLMLGFDGETHLVLDSIAQEAVSLTQPMDEWETLALENRADYQALESRQQAAQAGVNIAKSAYYPTLALSASYVDAHVPHALTISNAVNAGVALSYNLGALYKNGAKVRKAKAENEELIWHHEQLNEGIRSEIHHAYLNYSQQLKKIEVYLKAMEQADENYRITKNKYDNSLATTTDLLDADVARLQAQIDYAYAKADAVVAYHKLHESAGIPAADLTANNINN